MQNVTDFYLIVLAFENQRKKIKIREKEWEIAYFTGRLTTCVTLSYAIFNNF